MLAEVAAQFWTLACNLIRHFMKYLCVFTAVKVIDTLPHDGVVHRLQVFSQCVVHGGLLLPLAWL